MISDDAKLVLDNEAYKSAYKFLTDETVKRLQVGKLSKDEEHTAVLTLQILARVQGYMEMLISRESTETKVKEFNLKQKKKFSVLG